MPVTAAQIADRFPRLYHMAEPGSWNGVKEHGLLSTTALLDLFEVAGPRRFELESCRRPECVEILHRTHGKAVLRDQKPMDDSGLRRALGDRMTPAEWYRLLNDKVFFWLSEARLKKLLEARAYRDRRQTVLVVDTSALLEKHAPSVLLSPMNSGATKPIPHPRGPDTFLPLNQYPFDERLKVNRREPIVELAVQGGVPDIKDLVTRVYETGGGLKDVILFEREKSQR